MLYFSRGLNVSSLYNTLVPKIIKNDAINLHKMSLEYRFRELLYKYNQVKFFDKEALFCNKLKPYSDFKSNNIFIDYDNYKYIITSKNSSVSGNLYTALSIIYLKNEHNKPVFLMDNFNITDLSYMKYLNDEFSDMKLYFNLNQDYQVNIFKVEDFETGKIYIRKYCTHSQLENSLEKINIKFDTFYTFKDNNVEYKDTLLKYYNVVDVETNNTFRDEEFLLPKDLNKNNFVVLRS